MESFVIRVEGLSKIKAPAFNANQLRAIGAAAVHQVEDRVDRFKNIYDQAAKPYSDRGPIYIALSGRGTVSRKLGANTGTPLRGVVSVDQRAGTVSLRRNKTNLGGREVITPTVLKAMKASGRVYIISTRKSSSSSGGVRPGQIVAGHTGKSLKFANWAEYKRALGRTGLRDLYLGGKMRGAVAVVAVTATSVTIGFTREEEHLKALGNQKRDPWFGLSPNDRQAIAAFAQTLLPGAAAAMIT